MQIMGLRSSLLAVCAAGGIAALPIVSVAALCGARIEEKMPPLYEEEALGETSDEMRDVIESFGVYAVSAAADVASSSNAAKRHGYKLYSIHADSLYAQVGLVDGDMIERINGIELQKANVSSFAASSDRTSTPNSDTNSETSSASRREDASSFSPLTKQDRHDRAERVRQMLSEDWRVTIDLVRQGQRVKVTHASTIGLDGGADGAQISR